MLIDQFPFNLIVLLVSSFLKRTLKGASPDLLILARLVQKLNVHNKKALLLRFKPNLILSIVEILDFII